MALKADAHSGYRISIPGSTAPVVRLGARVLYRVREALLRVSRIRGAGLPRLTTRTADVSGVVSRIGRPIVLCSLAVALLTACPQPTGVWIATGATVDSLVFGVATRYHGSAPVVLPHFVVSRCNDEEVYREDDVVWLMAPVAERRPGVTQLNYGVSPRGYETRIGPKPLLPGCYWATTGGSGTVEFRVMPSGQVEETDHT